MTKLLTRFYKHLPWVIKRGIFLKKVNNKFSTTNINPGHSDYMGDSYIFFVPTNVYIYWIRNQTSFRDALKRSELGRCVYVLPDFSIWSWSWLNLNWLLKGLTYSYLIDACLNFLNGSLNSLYFYVFKNQYEFYCKKVRSR